MKRLIFIIFIVLLLAAPCFAKFQALIKVPASEYWNETGTSLPAEAMKVIKATGSMFTGDPAWNTREYQNYKIVNFAGNSTLERLNSFIALFKLDWKILAANDFYQVGEVKVFKTLLFYNKAELLNFITRDREYDINGNLVKEIPPTKVVFGQFWGFPVLEGK